MWVFLDLHIPVWKQNRWFCPCTWICWSAKDRNLLYSTQYIAFYMIMSLPQISKKKLSYWTISLLNHVSNWYQLCFTWQSTNICSITLTLLLMFLFQFWTLISNVHDWKEIVQLKYQSQKAFLWYCNNFCNNHVKHL